MCELYTHQIHIRRQQRGVNREELSAHREFLYHFTLIQLVQNLLEDHNRLVEELLAEWSMYLGFRVDFFEELPLFKRLPCVDALPRI